MLHCQCYTKDESDRDAAEPGQQFWGTQLVRADNCARVKPLKVCCSCSLTVLLTMTVSVNFHTIVSNVGEIDFRQFNICTEMSFIESLSLNLTEYIGLVLLLGETKKMPKST